MATRATKTAPAADEAQAAPPVDGEVVEEPTAPKFDAIKSLVDGATKIMASRLKSDLTADVDAKLKAITDTLSDLEALVTAQQPPEINPVAATLEEDYVHDMVDGAVTRKTEALVQAVNTIADRQAELDDRLTGVALLASERASGDPTTTYALKEDVGAIQGKAILTAIWKVMKDVTYVPKNGEYDDNKSTQYKFRSFDDTAAALGSAFRAHGIFAQSSVINHQPGTYEKSFSNGGSQHWIERSVTMEYVFTSLIDGSTLTVQSVGEGRDTSDKAASKAMTMAMKTALSQGFLLPTNDPDPDSERPGEEPTPPARQQAAPEQASQDHGQPTEAEAPQLSPEKAAEYAQGAFLVATGKKADAQGNWVRNQEDWGGLYQKAQKLGILSVTMPDGDTLQSKLLAARHTLPAK